MSLILSERQGLVEDPGDDQDLGRGEEREGEGSAAGPLEKTTSIDGRLHLSSPRRQAGSGRNRSG